MDADNDSDATRRRHSSEPLRSSSTESQIDPSYTPKILKPSGPSIDLSDEISPSENLANVLVLYSGGTIGMMAHPHGAGVYKPEPNFLVPELRKQPLFHDPNFALLYSKDEFEQPLVLPLSKEGKRIIYCIYEYEPLLDSSNMTYDDYGRLAADIMDNYHKFDGFVILHGTDTMGYTASALSFMLENLGKPVILTGSQIPIFEQRSDGRDNFLAALVIAGNYSIPEVAILFDNKLLRGNRCTKKDSEGFDAFGTPNMMPLAELETSIQIKWDIVFRHRGLHKFSVHRNMCPNVAVLRFFPSITKATVQSFLHPPMEGVVLQTYGAGNGPTAREDLIDVLKEASDAGIIIVNITQCAKGTVSPVYEAGKILMDAGVITGFDMTVEAALMKLSYVLSKDWPLEKKKEMMMLNMRGEMTVIHSKEEHSLLEYSLIGKMVETMRLSSPEEIQILRNAIFPPLLCSAAREGNNDALEKLRSVGAGFNMNDYDMRTPLHVAACEGHHNTVKYLLEYGAPVHVRDRFGHSPLDDAVRFARFDVIKLLMDAGAHLRVPATALGMHLCNSALQESLTNLKAWIQAGASVNQGDYDGRTALHLAIAVNNEEVAEYLISVGADPNQKDLFGTSPMDEAEKRGHTKMMKMMKEKMIVAADATPNGVFLDDNDE
ncbi:hypothetical protein LSH36_56g02010 [Paralvinella palmiformis]|uniref:asparaginase n=1 Tax=Paralvinella palmiformis TaxID=53620 RepID=A0AAD9K6R3_9ANNE|nr:hypothetical protein LSH36_56g02010 [Paralvinella palmiformis]